MHGEGAGILPAPRLPLRGMTDDPLTARGALSWYLTPVFVAAGDPRIRWSDPEGSGRPSRAERQDREEEQELRRVEWGPHR